MSDSSAAAAAASPAAAPKRASSRIAAGAAAAAGHPSPPSIEEQEAIETAAAMAASERTASFALYITEALDAWGADHSGWRDWCPDAESSTRAAVISALISAGAMEVPSMEALAETWAADPRYRGKAAPASWYHVESVPDSPAAAAVAPRALSPPPRAPRKLLARVPASAPAAVAQAPLASGPPRRLEFGEFAAKRRKLEQMTEALDQEEYDAIERAEATRDALAGAPAAAPPVNQMACPFCLVATVHVAAGPLRVAGLCPSPLCARRTDLPYSHEINVGITGQLNSGPRATPAASKSTLSKRDAHRVALATADGPSPLFDYAGPVSHAAALLEMGEAFDAVLCEPQSDSLSLLIRSGRFRFLGDATPKSIDYTGAGTAATVTEGELAVIYRADGTSSRAVASLADSQVTTYDEFINVLVRAILPSLIDRPAASLDWLCFTSTVTAIKAKHGEAVAMRYLAYLIPRRVQQRRPLAPVDDTVLRSSLSTASVAAPPTHTLGAAARPAGPGPAGHAAAGAAGAGGTPSTGHLCRSWNEGACVHGPACRGIHRCNGVGCTNPAEHRSKTCKHKPPPPSAQRTPHASRGAPRPAAPAPASK